MITDSIINLFFIIVENMLKPLDMINFTLNITDLEPVLQYFRMAAYVIPLKELMPIFSFFVAMMTFRIIISVIKTIWQLLPIL